MLVAEDGYFLADDLASMLRLAGAEVLGPVATCTQAIVLLEATSRQIDLAVLDINLRGELAFELADLLVARGTRLVFSSGYPTDFLPSRFVAVPLWRKPYQLPALLNSLRAMFRQA
ncbi:response regulator [Acetobacteraceae bacterium H6797]|nr:response regulator [Acetobacteraceae bacterium H6797]